MVEFTVESFEVRYCNNCNLLRIEMEYSEIIRQILEDGYQKEMEGELRKWRKEMEKEGHD